MQPVSHLAVMDKLDRIFEMQEKLNDRIGVSFKNMSDDAKVEWILKLSMALKQEVSELIDSVPWKWWAKYQKFDEQNAKVEVIDAIHFIVSIAQVLGMSADDIFDIYCKKNEINHKRQDSGYAVKDANDTRSI